MLATLGIPPSAVAELVVFTDGRAVKAAAHQIVGDELEIQLAGGGSYSVDRKRVARIIEDEVAASALPQTPAGPVRATPPPPPPPPAAATPSEVTPARLGMGRSRRNRAAADAQSPGMTDASDAFSRQ
jgi:hypothetical protein